MKTGRPKGHSDSDKAAITHIRISLKTKALINRLKVEHGYQTSDQVLANLLPQPQPHNLKQLVFKLDKHDSPQAQPQLQLTTQPVITKDMLLQRQDLNKLISATAKELYHDHVKPKQQRQRSSSNKGKPTKASARPRSSFKSHHKF
jgi:hypothetical protein